ncbi:MAG TPA: class I SAM-dependent methyltransferase [Thermoanaerobaculia bacterium]|nr:class I SAM-dependent methyltransferase [Thermoanaerobaculia bacterium]
MIRLDPPGTFCQNAAVWDILDRDARNFIDVGCGTGSVSRELCRRGLTGLGIDASLEAVEIAGATMAEHIAAGRYDVRVADVHDLPSEERDVAISLMVAEHLHDDIGFVRIVSSHVKPGGQVIIGVPGRRDHWGYEDEVAGHLRRYERADLESVLRAAGLEAVIVWSVAVPVANVLFHAGNRLVRRDTSAEIAMQGQREQTDTSGIREVRWKTVFPAWCRILLNRITLYPCFVLQRAFYGTSWGITLIGSGRRPRH